MQNIISQWLFSLKHYLLMCLLLSSPDRLPYNPYPIALTGFVYFLLGLLIIDEQRSYSLICMQILLEQGMLAGIVWIGLQGKQISHRFRQTFSALLGSNVIITAVAIPLVSYAQANAAADSYALFYTAIALDLWNLAVLSLIFKRSLDISIPLSAMISFCYFVIYQVTVYWLSS